MGEGQVGMWDPSHLEVNELLKDDRSQLQFIKETWLKRYNLAKKAKVGDSIQCPTCSKKIMKKSYQHKFCNSKHKDKFWNTVYDERRERAKLFNPKS